MPNPVWTCLPDGRCDYLSPQWVEFTGVPNAAQLGFEWLNQVHPDDRSALQDSWNKALTACVPFDGRFRLRHHSGCYHWFDMRTIPLRDAEGRIVQWFGVTFNMASGKLPD